MNILLLHGALGASSQFAPLAPLLEVYHRVHTLDFEGHGDAPLQARPFRFSHFAENVIEYLDNRSIEAAHIFGHSMGGHVGLYLARHYPGRVLSVFPFGVKFTWTPAIAERENSMLIPEKMRAKVPHYVQTLENRHAAAGWENVVEKIREQHLYLGENAPLTDEDLQQISQRVRVGLGDSDKLASFDEALRAYRLL